MKSQDWHKTNSLASNTLISSREKNAEWITRTQSWETHQTANPFTNKVFWWSVVCIVCRSKPWGLLDTRGTVVSTNSGHEWTASE